MGSFSNSKLARNNAHMIHLCQAEIEMIVLAASVLNDTMINRRVALGRPPYGIRVSHAIRGYMFQLIREIRNAKIATSHTTVIDL